MWWIIILIGLYVLYLMYIIIVAPLFIRKTDIAAVGKWAVVTGASDGIGKAIATELAKTGMNIVLISRTEGKLKAAAEELEKLFKIKTKIVVVDFTCGYKVYANIWHQLDGLEIGVLVNNVGINYTYPEYFLRIEGGDKMVLDILTCNTFPVTFMTRMILPQMVQRNKGVILNISSVSAVLPGPLLTVYGATKEYIDRFSRDLQMEYDHTGIIIQSVLPGFVHTNMTKSFAAGNTFSSTTTDVLAQAVIEHIGASDQVSPYWVHRLMLHVTYVLNFICPTLTRRLSFQILRFLRTQKLDTVAGEIKSK